MSRRFRSAGPWFLASLLAASLASPPDANAQSSANERAQQRIAAEVDRFTAALRAAPASDETWQQIKLGSEAALVRAADALRCGHPWLALQRLEGIAINVGAAEYVARRPVAERTELAAFDAEWRRMATELGDVLGSAAPGLDGVRPAAARAFAEIAWSQVRAFHAASRDYAASTDPKYGLFYVGQASAARDVVTLCRELSTTSPEPELSPAPPLRPIADEIDALERELLQAYRPPRALLFHSDFIAASSLLNEARELDDAGLHAGALLRLLQAALQSAPLRPKPAATGPEPLAARLHAFDEKFSKAAVDGSIGRIFLDSAEEALGASPPNEAIARTLLDDVLPRYFGALAPATPAPSAPPVPRAQTTLTLVRWPFT